MIKNMDSLIKQTKFSRATKIVAKKVLNAYFNEWVDSNLSKLRMTSLSIKNVGHFDIDYSLVYSDILYITKVLSKNPDNLPDIGKAMAEECGFNNYSELINHLHMLETLYNISVYKAVNRRGTDKAIGKRGKYESLKVKDDKEYIKRIHKFILKEKLHRKSGNTKNEILPKVPE